jgi:hypothetical protein
LHKERFYREAIARNSPGRRKGFFVIYLPNEKVNLFSSPGVYAWDRMLRFFLPIFHFRPFRGENGKLDMPGGGFHPQA